MKLDKFDREILRVLQQDATVSMADLSQRVGLSHTPCWRRVKRMEADGIILGKVTLLNSKKLNLGVSVFIYVTLKNHDGDSLTDFENAGLELSNFLWSEELIPLEVTSFFRPENLISDWTFSNEERADLINNSWMPTHPNLQSIEVKQRQLEVKERLKKEALKPRLNLNYNFLADGFDFSSDMSEGSEFRAFFGENYKWGVEFNYPLFLRKARGGLEQIRLEQLETKYKFQNKQLELQNKVRVVLQQLDLASEQVVVQVNILRNYQTLLEAENEKFRIGESSVFLLNSREQKLIETELKLAKLRAEYQKLRQKSDWARGQLN